MWFWFLFIIIISFFSIAFIFAMKRIDKSEPPTEVKIKSSYMVLPAGNTSYYIKWLKPINVKINGGLPSFQVENLEITLFPKAVVLNDTLKEVVVSFAHLKNADMLIEHESIDQILTISSYSKEEIFKIEVKRIEGEYRLNTIL